MTLPGFKFVIVGASTAGLSSAIALKRAGHNVLILEKEAQLGGPDSHKDLLRILYDAALKESSENGSDTPTVDIKFGADVLDVDFDTCSVTLRSGEVYSGNVLIGADGAYGPIRKRLLDEQQQPRDGVPRGLAVYSAVIPKALALKDPEISKMYDVVYAENAGPNDKPIEENMVAFWMGSNRGAQAFPAGQDQDIVFWVYTPDSSQDGSWTQPVEQKIADILGPCDSMIVKLGELAGPATCVQIKNYPELDEWVSQSGNTVVVGEAAHPFPTISLQTYSIAIEDGAFIGKTFSHTRDPARITELLNAFQAYRKQRCAVIDKSEKQYIDMMAIPDGEMQAGRDAAMRSNTAAGRNVMESEGDAELQAMWENMQWVFGYDPADDADEWWVSWGRLKQNAAASGRGGCSGDSDYQ
ncbi:hypothetical protein B0H17DRAFT_1202191 [Mycena rosella]|uniref:FAD/NAD(P)-binding domain-containing protein n=1 Tax=Mycena rosella TaxID=1033263 RepID=A0AAD7DG77_MYCRO|nr:hypothetical protein B0H17DRAFT_1202191 [Mycena rosella]